MEIGNPLHTKQQAYNAGQGGSSGAVFMHPELQWHRKVKVGELAEEGFCFFVVGSRGVDFF